MKSARVSICAVLVLAGGVVCTTTAASAKSFTVNPGESIQAAVDAASAGDTVKVMPGDYTETHAGTVAVRITKPLKLIAKSKLSATPPVKVRILPGPGQTDGIKVEPANPLDPDIDGLLIKGFTVEGFSNNGIWLAHVQNFKIKGNESINNLENGIWPTLSANGLVKKNVSYGSEDSSLWIEASVNVRVIKNDLHHSPTGLEITVSRDIQAKKNDIHDNTVGIGLYHPNAAGLPPIAGANAFWEITNNYVHDNNAPNTAPPGSLSSALPSGSGILLLGVDNITVKKNQVENNNFIGIGVIDWCVAVALGGPGSGIDCMANPPVVEAAPDNNQIISNELAGNAGSPPAGFEPFAADLVFLLGAGTNNCMSNNTPAAISFPPAGLPPC